MFNFILQFKGEFFSVTHGRRELLTVVVVLLEDPKVDIFYEILTSSDVVCTV